MAGSRIGVEDTAGEFLVADGVEVGTGTSRCGVVEAVDIGGAFGDSAGCALAFCAVAPPLEPSIGEGKIYQQREARKDHI